MKMPFGQYRGRPIDNCPRDYLLWLVERDIDDRLREAIRQTLAQWDAMKKPKRQAKKAKREARPPLPSRPAPGWDDVTARYRRYVLDREETP